MRSIILASIALSLATVSSAKITLPHVIGSNMVVQHSSDINLWGMADPDTKVTIKTSWNGKKTETRSDKDGNWKTTVTTPPASFEPLSITISDGEPLVLDNILSGDVWVCSGQSNMEMPLKGFTTQPVEGSLNHIMTAGKKADKLRFFTVERKRSYNDDQKDCGGEWQVASPQSAANFSAIGYFFGNSLSEAIDVPIGLIATDWGGTKIEAWMPLDALKECVSEKQYQEKQGNHWCKPSELYCGMIAPIRDFKAKGFIWYQGESNKEDIDHYDKMQAKMVERWRSDWGDKNNEMPFLYVMIAPYIYEGGVRDIAYPLFVEAQVRALDIIPNSGMATTTDVGEERLIHPSKKEPIGQRLAALALAKTYGMKGFEPNTARVVSHRVEKGKMILTMDNVNDGMDPWARTPIVGFEIAGEDKLFHPAKAWVRDNPRNEIQVWNDEVKNPVAVRYAFRNFVPANLTNTYGIPVAPFRTDNWNDVK